MAKDNESQQAKEELSNKIKQLNAITVGPLAKINELIKGGELNQKQKEDLKLWGGMLLQTQEYIQTLNEVNDKMKGIVDLKTNLQDLYNDYEKYCNKLNKDGAIKKQIDNNKLEEIVDNYGQDIINSEDRFSASLKLTAIKVYNHYHHIVNNIDNVSEEDKIKAQGMLDKLGKSFDIKNVQDVEVNNYGVYLEDDFLNQVEDLCKSNDELKKAKSAEQRYLLTKAILGTATVLHETTKAFGKTGFELTKNLAGLIEDCINYTLVQFAINPAKAFAKDLYSGVKGGIDMTLAKEEYAHWKGDGKTAAAKAGKIAQLVVANFIPVAIGGGVGAAAGTVTGTAKATWGATKGLAYAPVASFKDIKEKVIAIKNEGVSSVKAAVKNIKARTNYAENIRKEKLKEKFNAGVQGRT